MEEKDSIHVILEDVSLWALRSERLTSVLDSLPGKLARRGDHSSDVNSICFPYSVVNGIVNFKLMGIFYPLGYIDKDPFDTWYDARILRNTFLKMQGDSSIQEVHIDVDSPGGSASYIDFAADAFKSLSLTKKTTVTAYNSFCSAAYWVFCSASELLSTETSNIGSIGVLMTKIDITKYIEDIGYKVNIISTGARKADGSRYTKSTADVLASLQKKVDDLGKVFFSFVSGCRGISVREIRAMEGDSYIASEAIERRLVDKFINIKGGIMSNDNKTVSNVTLINAAGSGGDAVVEQEVPAQAAQAVPAAPAAQAPAAQAEPAAQVEPVAQSGKGMTADDVKALTGRALQAGMDFDEVLSLLDCNSLEEGTNLIFASLAKKDGSDGVSFSGNNSRVVLLRDKDDKLSAAIVDGLVLSSGFEIDNPADGAESFANSSFMGVVDEYLRSHGKYSFGMSDVDKVELVMSAGGGHTTSDFKGLIHTTAKTIVYREYISESSVWQLLCREVDAKDFGQINAVTLSDFPKLEPMDERGRFRTGTLEEKGEGYRIAKRGVSIGLTFEQMVGDEFNVFSGMLVSAALAARSMEDDLFWEYLLSNPKMKDGNPMMSPQNENVATSGSPPNLESVQEGRTAVRRYKTTKGRYRRVNPEYIVTGEGHASDIDLLLTSTGHPGDNKSSNVKNPLHRTLKLISEPSIDDSDNPHSWYLFCPRKSVPAFQASRLKGHKAPFVVKHVDHSTDSLMYTVRHMIGFGGIEPTGLYYNQGSG